MRRSQDASGQLTEKMTDLTAIPYFAWANRGADEMIVWMLRREL